MKNDDQTRREFMKTVGKLAVYTSPLMVALMQPSGQSLACSPGREIHTNFRKKKGPSR